MAKPKAPTPAQKYKAATDRAQAAQQKANLHNAKAQVARAELEAKGYRVDYDFKTGQEKVVKR